MANNYWIKLYIAILEDPKMCKLSDKLYRRVVELFLLAGETNQEGELPALDDIAWKLRLDEEQLETEMVELQKTGIISQIDGKWIVTKFAERQAAIPGAQRQSDFRDRKQKQQYYGDETETKQDSNELVTSRYVDTDTDTDTESDKIQKQIKKQKTAPVGAVDIPENLNTPQFLEAWKDWETHRKEKKKTLTPLTVKKQMAELSKYSPNTAIAMIEESIKNGWTGIFELKTQGDNGGLSREAKKKQEDELSDMMEKYYANKR